MAGHAGDYRRPDGECKRAQGNRSRDGRSGVYDVEVTDGEKLVATFVGHSREIGGSFG